MLLRPNDVAKLLNCSLSQVYNLKDKGELRWLRVGGMVRFRPEDVEEFIDTCVVQVSVEPRKAPRVNLKHIRI